MAGIGGVSAAPQTGAAHSVKKIEIPELQDKSLFAYDITGSDIAAHMENNGLFNEPKISYEDFKKQLFG